MQGKHKYSTVRVRSAQLLTVLLVVGLAMTALAGTALAQIDPYLFVDDSVHVDLRDGYSSFWVPIKLETASEISSVAFGLNYDMTCLTFDDQTDLNNDGLLDSVWPTYDVSNDHMTYSVRHEDFNGDGTKETVVIVVQGVEQLPNGDMVTMDLAGSDKIFTEIRFDVKPSCRNTNGIARTVNFSFFTRSGQPRIPSISDERGNSLTKPPLENHVVGGAYILHFNTAPTSLLLGGSTSVSFAENQVAGTLVGTLTNNDPDVPDSHTYALVPCAPDDNVAFKIPQPPAAPGDELRTNGPFDYESKKSFKVCVRVKDSYEASFVQTFTVNVTDINEPGQIIELDNTDVYEKELAGTLVGNLSTLGDPDVGDTHIYALPASPPADCAGTDNASFQIVGAQLQTAAMFDILVQDIYIICVSSTDTGSNQIFKKFTIDVWNQNDPPVAVDDPDDQVILANTGASYTFDVLTNDTDPEGDLLYVSSVTQPSNGGVVSLVGTPATGIEFMPADGYSGAVTFTYKAKERSGGNPLESLLAASVSFFVVSDEDRGDCNNDGMIDAADFSATQLEMWDTTNPGHPDNPLLPDWRTIYEGDYPGSPVGCDSNSSRNGLFGTEESVDISDVTCTVRLFFGDGCAAIMGASTIQTEAGLKVGSDLQVASDGSVAVPVVLDTGGQNVAAAAFIVGYDPSLFGVDPTDADSDGNPDAVAFNVPAGVAKIVSVDDTVGEIKIAVFGTSLPMPTLKDGVIATVTLYGKTSVAGQSPVSLKHVSVGDDLGRSIPVDFDGGVIIFGIGGNSRVFLPLMQMP